MFLVATPIAGHMLVSVLIFNHESINMKHTTNYQLPLRLNDQLASQLDEVSKMTGIQKSKICRMGISRIINDILEMDALESIRTLNQYYEEIQ